MSINNNNDSVGFGLRLKEERLRLKITQAEFAAIGRVSRPSQVFYESEQRVPDANYLASLSEKVDVMYILSGRRQKVAKAKVVEATAIHAILTTIDAWSIERERPLDDHFRAELVSLFLQQVDSNGQVDTDLIKKTLRLMK